jgi:hypothetical protein
MSSVPTDERWDRRCWSEHVDLAVRTAKWRPRSEGGITSDRELEEEIENAIHLAGRVLSTLVSRKDSICPQKKEMWWVPKGEDVPKWSVSSIPHMASCQIRFPSSSSGRFEVVAQHNASRCSHLMQKRSTCSWGCLKLGSLGQI